MGGTFAHAQDGLERHERQIAAAEWQQMIAAERQAGRALAEVDALTRALTAAVLIANGYHVHKRQWRKRRYEQSE
jgi:hypothetical protein